MGGSSAGCWYVCWNQCSVLVPVLVPVLGVGMCVGSSTGCWYVCCYDCIVLVPLWFQWTVLVLVQGVVSCVSTSAWLVCPLVRLRRVGTCGRCKSLRGTGRRVVCALPNRMASQTCVASCVPRLLCCKHGGWLYVIYAGDIVQSRLEQRICSPPGTSTAFAPPIASPPSSPLLDPLPIGAPPIAPPPITLASLDLGSPCRRDCELVPQSPLEIFRAARNPVQPLGQRARPGPSEQAGRYSDLLPVVAAAADTSCRPVWESHSEEEGAQLARGSQPSDGGAQRALHPSLCRLHLTCLPLPARAREAGLHLHRGEQSAVRDVEYFFTPRELCHATDARKQLSADGPPASSNVSVSRRALGAC